jgi:glutamate synthase domain-containing protein 3
VATQDPELRKRFTGKPEHLANYLTFVAEDIRRIMARLGFRKFQDMIGRVDCLDSKPAIEHWKARGLDFSAVLARPRNPYNCDPRLTKAQPRRLDDHLDWTIMEKAKAAIEDRKPVRIELPIRNVHRAVGAILSNRIVNRYGAAALPDGTVDVHFRGSAGQSFGAFLVPGVTFHLVGDANDYVGKGLSGGRIIVQTPPESRFEAHRNIVAGNVILYGATGGELYVNGVAGERFCVRNSGATAVVEGIGDHGCEYMTGGLAVILGETGRNFAAGMSGGIAYVLDEMQLFDTRCNLDMVDLEYVWQQDDREVLRTLIERHFKLTASRRAANIIENWNQMVGRFVKVMPIDYRKSLQRIRQREDRRTETTPATEEVFHG